MREDHDGVGTDASEREMREGDLPGNAEQEIVAEREGDPDQHLAIGVGRITAEPERQRRGGDDRNEPDQSVAGGPHQRASRGG